MITKRELINVIDFLYGRFGVKLKNYNNERDDIIADVLDFIDEEREKK